MISVPKCGAPLLVNLALGVGLLALMGALVFRQRARATRSRAMVPAVAVATSVASTSSDSQWPSPEVSEHKFSGVGVENTNSPDVNLEAHREARPGEDRV